MNLLAVVPADVKKRLNPNNDPSGFMGMDSRVTTEDIEESIEEFVETVFSRIPSRYGGLTETADGEILNRSALGTENTLQLKLFPVSNVRIWINMDVPWASRRSSDSLRDDNGCTVDAATGLVTLDKTLNVDDYVVAQYDHNAMPKCHLLRRIVVDLTAAEWARRLYPDDQRFDRYTEWEKSAWFDLARMKNKDGERMGIRMFDRLELIDETQEERMTGGGELAGDTGML